MPQRKLQVYQFATNPVCARYRFEIPARALNRRSGIQAHTIAQLSAEVFREIVDSCDLFVLQRLPMSPKLLKIINILQARGIRIIFDIDDDLLSIPDACRLKADLKPGFKERLLASIRACNAVQCSTSPLAKQMSKYNSEVIVLGNYIDDPPVRNIRKRAGGPIVIAYCAGENHGHDWTAVEDSYNVAIKALEERGVDCETWIVGDYTIFESVLTPSKRFFPLLPFDDYMALLAQIDISIMPLAPNKFNQSKSDIKFLESASQGATVLASDLVYGQTVVQGETGFTFQSTDEFEIRLKSLVMSGELRQKMRAQAYEFVTQNRVISRHIDKWETFYMTQCPRL